MTAHSVIIKLKPNSLNIVRNWQETILEYKEQAMQTLKDEGVSIESWFLAHLDGNDYLIAYMGTDDIQKAHDVAKDSTHEIDIIHKAFKKETWAERIETELLIDLTQ